MGVDILRAENIRTLNEDEDEDYDYGDDFDANSMDETQEQKKNQLSRFDCIVHSFIILNTHQPGTIRIFFVKSTFSQ